jgi:aldose 1-epimerase
MITIRSALAAITIAPEVGGRLAQIEVSGRPLLVDGVAGDHPMLWGSFPMAPWAGRLRDGRFEIDGQTIDVGRNLGQHAIHGTTFESPWNIDEASGDGVTMSSTLDWPLGGLARQRIRVDDRSVVCDLSVAADSRAMPAEVGWHPWFVKPDRLVFTPEAMYERDDELPTGELIAPTDGPWDDCFINTDPVQLHYDDLVVTVGADCDHWVVYDEPTHATCVEPQSGPPDAFHLRPRILRPGEELARSMTISWATISPTER